MGRDFDQRHRCLILSTLALFACTRPGVAAARTQPGADYLSKTYTTADGLPLDVVNDVLQTRDGFLIVGTPSGVARFDGHRFAEMNSDPPREIVARSLSEGPDGDLWVSTRFGVYRFPYAQIDQGRQKLSEYHLGQGAADSVRCLRFTRAGALWAGTAYGLFYFAKDHFQQVSVGNVQHIEETGNGNLLVTTIHGFFEWDGSHVIERPVPKSLGVRGEDIFHVFRDRGGVMWYCTSKGIFRQSDTSLKRFLPDPTGEKNGALRAYQDPAGNIWFLTAAGVYRASSETLERVSSEVNARAIIGDRNGNIWIGTNGTGLIRFKNRTIRTFTVADGLPNNLVMTVLATAEDRLWAGNNCGGLSWFDGTHFHTYAEKDGLTNSCVSALAEDSRHDLWVGTSGGGLFRFHGGRFRAFTKTEGLGSNTVISVLTAHDGSLWIATNGGLTHLRDGVLRNYTTADGLSDNIIANVLEDSSGVIWASTDSAIDRLDGDKFVEAFRPHAHGELVLAGEGQSGDLLVQDGAGINRLKDGKLTKLVPLNGTDIHVVQNSLWMTGGSAGFTRVGPASLRSWQEERQEPVDYTEFGPADGLLTEECGGGYPNMTATKDGKLWVATLAGVAMLDISRLPPSGGKPFEYISEVAVDRKKRNAARELVLQPGMHHTELQLGSIELSSPERAHIQYRLEGIDSEWLDVKPDGTAVYSTIPHGSYFLHVRASNGDGVWDRQGIVYRVTQEPFFYETTAFRLLMIAMGCILVAVAYRVRLRQESARIKMRLEERGAERERIARDLHDTLLQSFQGSLFEVQAARNLFPRRLEDAMHTLDEAIHSAEAAIAEGRDAIRDLRSGSTVASGIAQLLAAAGQELSEVPASDGGSPAFRVTVEGSPRDLGPVLQDELYRIGREILRNAFHHAHAKKVEVELRYGVQEFRVRFRDDGIGIDPKVLEEGARPGHWGLPGVRERAKAVGAQMEFWSEEGVGTEVQVTVPGSKAYERSPEVFVFRLFRKRPRPRGE